MSVFFLGTLPTKCANIASATLPKWATFCLARLESFVRTFEVLLVCPSLEILLTDPTGRLRVLPELHLEETLKKEEKSIFFIHL